MKLLVFADTHGASNRMLDVVYKERDANAVFFLGDGVRDVDELQEAEPRLALYRVRGNCDFAGLDPLEGLSPFGGFRIFYTHGHNYNVKYSLDTLWRAAKRSGADAAMFGHTHTAHYELRGGIHLFNPGSLNFPRSGPASYGVVTIREGEIQFNIRPYETA